VLEVASTGSGRELRLRSGAGHGIPGLARRREFRVRLSLLDDHGQVLARLALPVSWRNRLMVDETRHVRLPDPAGAVAIRAVVDHLFDGDLVATILDRTLELP